MFQALIGTVQTIVPTRGVLEYESRVSSPHRYCPNPIYPDGSVREIGVSSPHRYCPNRAGHPSDFVRSLAFQALIGTVQTMIDRSRLVAYAAFQALIGTVQTPVRPVSPLYSSPFQALIGTVQTCDSPQGLLAYFRVSSPHRYCPNLVRNTGATAASFSFTPS